MRNNLMMKYMLRSIARTRAFSSRRPPSRIRYSTLCLHDQWNKRMQAMFITLAVANSQVPRMPWEQLLWGSEAIPDIPTEIKVPDKLLANGRNEREVALGAFGTGWCSLSTMKTTLEKKHGRGGNFAHHSGWRRSSLKNIWMQLWKGT